MKRRRSTDPDVRKGLLSIRYSFITSSGLQPNTSSVLKNTMADGDPLSRSTVEKYLDCGNLKNGFARVRCPECKNEYL